MQFFSKIVFVTIHTNVFINISYSIESNAYFVIRSIVHIYALDTIIFYIFKISFLVRYFHISFI